MSNIPKIRFKGFTEDWEQRKVGELIEDYIEKTIIQNQYPVLTSSQQQGIVFQEDYFADRQVTTNDNIGYYVLPYGYFTYRSRSDTDVFVFNRNSLIDKGIISYYYPVFSAKGCDSNFLLRRLNHGIKKQFSMAAEGTGQKVLAHNKFKNMVVDVPSISEQVLIGQLFERLDNLITLHQRKCDELSKLKKFILQKMFPKANEQFPEIRFKGFTEAWEHHKLGELLQTLSFKPFLKEPEHDGKYEIIQQGNDPIIGFANGIPCNDYEDTVIFGDHTLSLYKPNGPFFVATDGVRIVKGKKKIDGFYLMALLEKYKPQSEGYKRYYGILADSSCYITRKAVEQRQIGSLFRSLDNIIILHQRQLRDLQNIKKYMLQNMFV